MTFLFRVDKYISHGYALTAYKSQGQTEKHVIYHAGSDQTINFNQAYVGITRGKESVNIYTDSKSSLLAKVQKPQVKTSTLEYDMAAAKAVVQSRLDEIASRIPSIHEIKPTPQRVVRQAPPPPEISQSKNRGMER